jgi:hypothetical protein
MLLVGMLEVYHHDSALIHLRTRCV